mgnify:FL=1
MATKAKTAQATPAAREESGDGPLMDGMTASVKKMSLRGRERGFVTYDEINAALPSDQVSSEQIEDTLALLSEQGITVTEGDEGEEAATPAVSGDGAEPVDEAEEKQKPEEAEFRGNLSADAVGRTDDPVRMYLREMGSIELLSREGEIAIAKRIEAGREKMIGSLCESPLTLRAVVHWREALV